MCSCLSKHHGTASSAMEAENGYSCGMAVHELSTGHRKRCNAASSPCFGCSSISDRNPSAFLVPSVSRRGLGRAYQSHNHCYSFSGGQRGGGDMEQASARAVVTTAATTTISITTTTTTSAATVRQWKHNQTKTTGHDDSKKKQTTYSTQQGWLVAFDVANILTALVITTNVATTMRRVVMMPTPDPDGPDTICPELFWLRSEYLQAMHARYDRTKSGNSNGRQETKTKPGDVCSARLSWGQACSVRQLIPTLKL